MTETIGPMKETPEQITVNTYNWGPCLIKVKARDTLIQQLKEQDMEAFQMETESLIALQIAALTKELVDAEGGSQDPLVALKSRELDLKAMDMQRKAAETQQDQQRKLYEFEQRIDLDKMKREDAEVASQERIRVADEKLDLTERKIENEENKNEG